MSRDSESLDHTQNVCRSAVRASRQGTFPGAPPPQRSSHTSPSVGHLFRPCSDLGLKAVQAPCDVQHAQGLEKALHTTGSGEPEAALGGSNGVRFGPPRARWKALAKLYAAVCICACGTLIHVPEMEKSWLLAGRRWAYVRLLQAHSVARELLDVPRPPTMLHMSEMITLSQMRRRWFPTVGV